MLKVRRPQTEAFTVGLEDRLAPDLRRFFPGECGALDDAGLRAAIRRATERAASHGIEADRDLRLFATLCVAFGSELEKEPWAAAILSDPRRPRDRVDRLYRAAMDRERERALADWARGRRR